ncbi:MAG: MBL fold metallo-hydrolase, partial [Planctomycetales bacterium]|nr:MBL fold metallo-hydrolase [Planctomycetales bacterium]
RGRSPSLVALTHAHPDHLGAAAAVCQAFSAPLACHAADADAAAGKAPMQPSGWQITISNQVFGGPPHPVSRLLSEGDELAGFRVWHAPGHTPGHLVLFREQDGVAIVGDVLLGMHLVTLRAGLHSPPPFFCTDVAENRRSMLKVFEARPSQILFGHGRPQPSGPNWDDFAAGIQKQVFEASHRDDRLESA